MSLCKWFISFSHLSRMEQFTLALLFTVCWACDCVSYAAAHWGAERPFIDLPCQRVLRSNRTRSRESWSRLLLSKFHSQTCQSFKRKLTWDVRRLKLICHVYSSTKAQLYYALQCTECSNFPTCNFRRLPNNRKVSIYNQYFHQICFKAANIITLLCRYWSYDSYKY